MSVTNTTNKTFINNLITSHKYGFNPEPINIEWYEAAFFCWKNEAKQDSELFYEKFFKPNNTTSYPLFASMKKINFDSNATSLEVCRFFENSKNVLSVLFGPKKVVDYEVY